MGNGLTLEHEITAKQGIYNRYIKRGLDIVVGLVGTVVFFLPLAVIILCCYSFGKDKGRVVFTQERMGLNGQTFKIIKFRSMVENAEEMLKQDKELYQKYLSNGYKFPEGEDPRLTKIGAFIRKTSLDEFPQFINILKGDMSFVGPRPILAAELEEYTEQGKKELLSVKPGATGWWQVSGRSDVLYPERCQLELYYPRHFSFRLDVKITLLTVRQVLSGRGAH
ncbi:sugar transferase [Streptococcus dentasini]